MVAVVVPDTVSCDAVLADVDVAVGFALDDEPLDACARPELPVRIKLQVSWTSRSRSLTSARCAAGEA